MKRLAILALLLAAAILLMATPLIAKPAIAATDQSARWGALALGGNGFGAVRGSRDEASAVSGALRQCEESGGGGACRIRMTYRNQCAAYATGEDRYVGISHAASITKAMQLALRSCRALTSHCTVAYGACSLPDSFN